MRYASLVVIVVALPFASVSGCVFEPEPDKVVRDAWIRPDTHVDPGGGYELPARDPGVRPDGFEDGGPWQDFGVDGGPVTDAWTPDAGSDVLPGDVTDPGECAVPDPSGPFFLEVSGLIGNGQYWPDATVSGQALVEAMEEAEGTYVPARSLRLRMLDDDSVLEILWSLGPRVRIPVSVGQRVEVYVTQRTPWWRDLAVAIWDQEGMPLFFAHDGAYLNGWFDCDGMSPCPTFHSEEDDCPAVEATCGTAFHVPVFLWLDGGLSSSEAPMPLKQGGAAVNLNGVRYLVHHAYRQEQMECVDYPNSWFSGAAVRAHLSDAMGCACQVTSDCARHEVCETQWGRCVPNLCSPEALALAGTDCPAGALCDPYTGTCVIDAPAPVSCDQDLDCGAGAMYLCHHEMRLCTDEGTCEYPFGGVCSYDSCQNVDCGTPFCSSLKGLCVECLADCDCDGVGPGMFCDGVACRACDPAKIALTQENGGRWEFYELCASGASSSAVQAALRTIDSTISCGVTGVFAQCQEGQIACHGGGFERVSPHGMLDDASWRRLCDLSLREDVHKIVGGHYL